MQHRHHRGTLRRVEISPLADAAGSRLTMRLRLEPVGPANAPDLWLVHNDDEVSYWYGNEKPSLEQAEQWARFMGDSWRLHGVHKWIAYDRVSGEVVGRGGLSRTPVDDDWGQIYAFLPEEPWVRVAHEVRHPLVAHANWLEIGWALRREFWGRGYASEIGRAGLSFAFGVLGVQAVVSCTVRHNVRSRAVMERIGMRYSGEIRSRGMMATDSTRNQERQGSGCASGESFTQVPVLKPSQVLHQAEQIRAGGRHRARWHPPDLRGHDAGETLRR